MELLSEPVLLETFIASNHAAQQELQLTPKHHRSGLRRSICVQGKSFQDSSELKENDAKKAIKTRKKGLPFATYVGMGLFMFFVAKYGPEEASPVFVLLFVGALVALFRAFNIDPDEGLESYRASYSREEQEILDMDKLSDDELRDILLISDRSERSVEIKSKLNANNLDLAMTGWVYVMLQLSMPGLLKIGMSAQDSKIHRVKELSQTTSVPKPFLQEYQILVDESYAETRLHQLFLNHRLENREFSEKLTVSQIVQTARDEFDIKLEEFPSKNADEVELKISQTAEQVEAEGRVADAEAEKERRNAWLRRVRHEAREIRSQYYDTVARHKELMLWRKVFTFGLYRGKQFDVTNFQPKSCT